MGKKASELFVLLQAATESLPLCVNEQTPNARLKLKDSQISCSTAGTQWILTSVTFCLAG